MYDTLNIRASRLSVRNKLHFHIRAASNPQHSKLFSKNLHLPLDFWKLMLYLCSSNNCHTQRYDIVTVVPKTKVKYPDRHIVRTEAKTTRLLNREFRKRLRQERDPKFTMADHLRDKLDRPW